MIIIFCGAPGSGKTTIAKLLVPKLAKLGTVRVFTSDGLKPPVYEKFLNLLSQNAGKYDFLLFDATFYKKAYREKLKSRAHQEKIITVFFEVSLETALERNQQRKAGIPVPGVRAIFGKMEKPEHPEVYLDTEKLTADQAADKIFDYIAGASRPKKKRIFVALAASKNLQNAVMKWQKRHAKLPVRWLSGKNLHITLVPPWYEEDLAKVYARLKTVKSRAFNISFERVRLGSDPRRPRLIWAEGEAPEVLLSLQKDLEQALGVESERRPWKLHLTLARFRPEDFLKFSLKKLDEKVAWEDRVESFVMMESHLSPKGAEYEVIKKYGF